MDMKPKARLSSLLKVLISVAIVVLSLFLLQRLLIPKYVADVVEGAFVAEYYQEENKDFDVVFVGDCEVYENFSPATLWEEYGIHSYIRGSAEQYVWQSYYLLEDTLRYHTPQVVIFNIQAMQFNESQNEAYNRMTLEGMEWSMSKVNAIFASMTEQEQFLDYVFPILRYHTRWSELTTADVQYLFDTKPVSHNGYYMRVFPAWSSCAETMTSSSSSSRPPASIPTGIRNGRPRLRRLPRSRICPTSTSWNWQMKSASTTTRTPTMLGCT